MPLTRMENTFAHLGTNIYAVKGTELETPCWAFVAADNEHVRWHLIVFDEDEARRYQDYYLNDSSAGKHKYKFHVNNSFYVVEKYLHGHGFIKD